MRDLTAMAPGAVGGLIADALVDAHLIEREHVDKTAHIAATEIEARLVLGNVITSDQAGHDTGDGKLYRRIDEVMHFIWDPIGVAGIPEARNEYNGYVPQVFRMLKEGADEERIAAHLMGLVTSRMGMDGDAARAREVASVLVNWRDVLAEKSLR